MNTASQCGYTPQYEGLEALSNREIVAFSVNQYAIDFPMFAKIPVKGKEAHPFYAELAKATWDGAALEFP